MHWSHSAKKEYLRKVDRPRCEPLCTPIAWCSPGIPKEFRDIQPFGIVLVGKSKLNLNMPDIRVCNVIQVKLISEFHY